MPHLAGMSIALTPFAYIIVFQSFATFRFDVPVDLVIIIIAHA